MRTLESYITINFKSLAVAASRYGGERIATALVSETAAWLLGNINRDDFYWSEIQNFLDDNPIFPASTGYNLTSTITDLDAKLAAIYRLDGEKMHCELAPQVDWDEVIFELMESEKKNGCNFYTEARQGDYPNLESLRYLNNKYKPIASDVNGERRYSFISGETASLLTQKYKEFNPVAGIKDDPERVLKHVARSLNYDLTSEQLEIAKLSLSEMLSEMPGDLTAFDLVNNWHKSPALSGFANCLRKICLFE